MNAIQEELGKHSGDAINSYKNDCYRALGVRSEHT